MTYAISATGDSFRAINDPADLLPGETLSDMQPVLAPVRAALLAYATQKRQQVADDGITVNVGAAASPVDCAADTSAAGQANVASMIRNGVTDWYQSGGKLTVTADQLKLIDAAIAAFILSTWAALATVEAEIEAGTIASEAEIDAASWPANS